MMIGRRTKLHLSMLCFIGAALILEERAKRQRVYFPEPVDHGAQPPDNVVHFENYKRGIS